MLAKNVYLVVRDALGDTEAIRYDDVDVQVETDHEGIQTVIVTDGDGDIVGYFPGRVIEELRIEKASKPVPTA